jgi:hypothetical protein
MALISFMKGEKLISFVLPLNNEDFLAISRIGFYVCGTKEPKSVLDYLPASSDR